VSSRLVGRSYVADRAGPRTRLPVFDGPVLAAFATEPAHRLFLAELPASYARVASGVVWRRESRGWRRQRWNELDLPDSPRCSRSRLPTPRADGDREALRILLSARDELTTVTTAQTNRLRALLLVR
jgi:hypothetical protein